MTDADEPTRDAERRVWRRLSVGVLALMLALLCHSAWRVGPTFDEHFYAASGRAYWATGDFALNREHPPLVKLLIGAPLALAGVEVDAHDPARINFPASFFYQRHAEDLDRNLFLARLPICLLTLALAFAVYRVARHAFGERAGFVALLLFALNPNVLAHGSLATLDAGLTAFLFFAVVAFVRALERPSARTTLLAGVCFGLANLAKFTALLLGPIFLALAALAALRARAWRPLATTALVLLVGLSTFAAGYGFEARSVNSALAEPGYLVDDPAPDADAVDRVFSQGWIAGPVAALFGAERAVPLLTALKGIDYQAEHASHGHDTWFHGRVLRAGADFEHGNPVPHYYLVVLLVKSPVAWVLLTLAGIALCFRRGPGRSALRTAAFLGTPLVLLAVFSTGNALLGVKYVLPVLPFCALLGAGVAAIAPRAAVALATIAVLEAVWIHPHELLYYNALAGGPSGGPRITVVGDDWGQGVRALGRFYARHADEIEELGGLYYEPYTAGDLAAFGLEHARPVRGQVKGVLAVHLLHFYRRRDVYAILDDYEPFAVLDRSVALYDLSAPPPGGNPLAAWTR